MGRMEYDKQYYVDPVWWKYLLYHILTLVVGIPILFLLIPIVTGIFYSLFGSDAGVGIISAIFILTYVLIAIFYWAKAALSFKRDARALKSIDEGWSPNWPLYSVGYLFVPPVTASIYLWNRSRTVGIPWARMALVSGNPASQDPIVQHRLDEVRRIVQGAEMCTETGDLNLAEEEFRKASNEIDRIIEGLPSRRKPSDKLNNISDRCVEGIERVREYRQQKDRFSESLEQANSLRDEAEDLRSEGDLESAIDAYKEAIDAYRSAQGFSSDVEFLNTPQEEVQGVEDSIDETRQLWLERELATVEDRLAPIEELVEDNEIDAAESILEDTQQYVSNYSLKPATTEDPFQEALEEAYQPIFNYWCDSIANQIASLEDSLEPYFDYEEYLTYYEKNSLVEQIEVLQKDSGEMRSKLRTEFLSSQDRQRLLGLATSAGQILSRLTDLDSKSSVDDRSDRNVRKELEEIKDLLSEYNSVYIDRELASCEDFFAELKEKTYELTLEQRKAVIRNDTYNQVIAAAGTGKTLVLAIRVAYLVFERDVDPQRILVATFTNEARDELASRLETNFGITDVEITTLHSFGYGIVDENRHQKPTPAGRNDITNLIDDIIRRETSRKSGAFYDHFFEFLLRYEDRYLEETDFETKAEYVDARSQQSYTTFQGEAVKSRAEKQIADFLFLHQVDYQYEAIAEWADTDPEKTVYSPDFYLPEHDIYIEHWGLDESGEVAPWFSRTSEDYRQELLWKREQFEESKYDLVGTYEFEREAGQLRDALRSRLQHSGVELDRMAYDDLVDSAFDYQEKEGQIKRYFRDFITNAKTFQFSPVDIEPRLDRENPRQYHFGKCGIHLLGQYQRFLVENSLIDFSDMIFDAVNILEENPSKYKSQYDHVLVDEFQDVSASQIELVQALTGPTGAKLFCVGDDWQSIYSFQGAVVEYFIDFEEEFGPPSRTHLTANFRSPESVLKAGNELISHNEMQINKEVVAQKSIDAAPRLHTITGTSDHDYTQRISDYGVDLLESYLANGADPGDIMVLCRYDNATWYLNMVKQKLSDRGIPYDGKDETYRPSADAAAKPDYTTIDEGVSVYSVHQSKGREADHVLLVHAAEGPYGFPPQKRENELLEPVQDLDVNSLEEERRLFYVAMTRTKESLDVLTREGLESRFLDEIEDYIEPAHPNGSLATFDKESGRVSCTARVAHLYEDTHEKVCQKGILEDPTGSILFVSWNSNDPMLLKEGTWYEFENVKIAEYNGNEQLKLKWDSRVKEVAEPTKLNDSPIQDDGTQKNTEESPENYLGQAKRGAPYAQIVHISCEPLFPRKEDSVRNAFVGKTVTEGKTMTIAGIDVEIVRTDPSTADGGEVDRVTVYEETSLRFGF